MNSHPPFVHPPAIAKETDSVMRFPPCSLNLLPRRVAALVGFTSLLWGAGTAHAATWADWWLPEDYSVHGRGMDWLFIVILWISIAIFVGTNVVLVYFLWKYRFRPERRKGIFSHGNTKLEMAWTLAPAVVLIGLSLASKRVWDEYRQSPIRNDPDKAQVMVIGQQFKWNVIYPGPDGKVGRYLTYPKPTDPKFNFKPAMEANAAVATAFNENPLGQFIDPANPTDPGLDDDTVKQPGRPLILPSNRPIEIILGSRDVLHSFFLPNFRVKLDSVPGLRGLIHFKATTQSTKSADVDAVPADKLMWLDATTPRALFTGNPKTWQIFDPKITAPDDADPFAVDPRTLEEKTLNKRIGTGRTRKNPWLASLQGTLNDAARNRLTRRLAADAAANGTEFSPELVVPGQVVEEVAALRADLKRMGIARLDYVDRSFEIICEELCGQGHYTMNGQMIVVSRAQYDGFVKGVASAAAEEATPGPAGGATPVSAATRE